MDVHLTMDLELILHVPCANYVEVKKLIESNYANLAVYLALFYEAFISYECAWQY